MSLWIKIKSMNLCMYFVNQVTQLLFNKDKCMLLKTYDGSVQKSVI